jgi:hypothetical protein
MISHTSTIVPIIPPPRMVTSVVFEKDFLVGLALPVELVPKHHHGVALTRVLFLIVPLAARGSHFFVLCQ